MKKNIVFISGLLFIGVTVALVEFVTLRKTAGHFCYPLDDTFIHMALSKNLAIYGNWGISPASFASASSSPLFTILLAILFKIFTPKIWLPFLLSSLGSLLTLWGIQRELNRYSTLRPFNKVICVLLTLLCGTMPAMTLLGMEHSLQIALTLLFLHSVASLLTSEDRSPWWGPALIGACMAFTRYENLFVIAAAALLLFACKKYLAAFFIPAAAAIPLLAFGLYSKMHGGFMLPNSVLIKGNQNLKYFLNGGSTLIQATASIGGIFVIALIIIYKRLESGKFNRDAWVLSMFAIAVLFHSVFAAYGWFYRYETYLIIPGVLHLSKMGLEWFQERGFAGVRRRAIPVGVAAVLCYSLPVRGLNSFRNSVRAIYNIYEQQYQMGLFLKEYYEGETIAANDVGAISYMAGLNTIDMWGLGNTEVATARKNNYWNNEFIRDLVARKETRVVVMYDSWFDAHLPDKWFKVAEWEMPYNYICGDIKVAFYGVSENEASILKTNLEEFAVRLPGDVKVRYFR